MQPGTATEETALDPERGVDLPGNKRQAASTLEIVLRPRKVARIFIGLVLTIAAVGAVANFLIVRVLPGKDDRWMHLAERFDLDFEPSFCGWYSSIALLICSVLLGTIAVAKKRGQDRFAFHWLTLAILFLLMSIDESVQIHEMSVKSLRGWLGTTGILYFA